MLRTWRFDFGLKMEEVAPVSAGTWRRRRRRVYVHVLHRRSQARSKDRYGTMPRVGYCVKAIHEPTRPGIESHGLGIGPAHWLCRWIPHIIPIIASSQNNLIICVHPPKECMQRNYCIKDWKNICKFIQRFFCSKITGKSFRGKSPIVVYLWMLSLLQEQWRKRRMSPSNPGAWSCPHRGLVQASPRCGGERPGCVCSPPLTGSPLACRP